MKDYCCMFLNLWAIQDYEKLIFLIFSLNTIGKDLVGKPSLKFSYRICKAYRIYLKSC